MLRNRLLVTGSSGLIGSEVVRYFDCEVHGIDNNQRRELFGAKGDTRANQKELEKLPNFTHHEIDIRDRLNVHKLVKLIKPDAVIHCAAQPSHDLAASMPFEDFDINARGTLNLLEAIRYEQTPFVYLSTNKVYGDGPNKIPMEERDKRYEFIDRWANGIHEHFSIDQCKHSLFGASKLSADIYTQEYGRYFEIPTAILRGGCLTGPNHAGVELHGFLNYLIKCNVEQIPYTVFGYKGKQVRDNIHAYDVVRFIDEFLKDPGIAKVYNIGGGYDNSCSILEAFEMIEAISGKEMIWSYREDNRIGDHICYYSDLAKCKRYDWTITKDLGDIFNEIYQAQQVGVS
jgi:CDP-paratose 2-epimerase